MKKAANDKSTEKNPVHTPTPPQVMDPSQLPKRETQKEGSKKGKKKISDKNEEGNEKLAPNEEL